jgi:hypothetical protein
LDTNTDQCTDQQGLNSEFLFAKILVAIEEATIKSLASQASVGAITSNYDTEIATHHYDTTITTPSQAKHEPSQADYNIATGTLNPFGDTLLTPVTSGLSQKPFEEIPPGTDNSFRVTRPEIPKRATHSEFRKH